MMRLYGSKLLLLGTAAILLGGCGGGGGGSGDETDPPQAVDDTASTKEDTVVNINVTANDTDSDGTIDKASVTVQTDPENGTATPKTDGTIDYTPKTGFFGTDTFTYTVKDDRGATSNPATVTITVNGKPTATNDTASTLEDTLVNINVTANDTDPDGNSTIDKSTVTITQPANGSATVNATTGVVTYTPNDGFFGTDTFTYTVRDDAGNVSNPATVTVSVTAVASGNKWDEAQWDKGHWAP